MRNFRRFIFLGVAAAVMAGIIFPVSAQGDEAGKPAKGDVKFFKGIPVFPGSIYQPYSDYEEHQEAWYMAKTTVDDVEAFYRKTLSPRGWMLTKKKGDNLYFVKENKKEGFRILINEGNNSDPNHPTDLSYAHLSSDELKEIVRVSAAIKESGETGTLMTMTSSERLAEAENLVEKATNLLSEGKIDEAFIQVNKALNLDPDNGFAYGIRAAIYEQKGKSDLAKADNGKFREIQEKAMKQYGR